MSFPYIRNLFVFLLLFCLFSVCIDKPKNLEGRQGNVSAPTIGDYEETKFNGWTLLSLSLLRMRNPGTSNKKQMEGKNTCHVNFMEVCLQGPRKVTVLS